MTTTIGLFHADFARPEAGFRAGITSVATPPQVVPLVLPVLVNSRAAVAALTGRQPHESLLKALLAQGWQDLNFLYEDGAWYEVKDMLGTRGRQLAPAVAEPAAEEVTEPLGASEKQLTTLHNVTKCHVFDHDRDALRAGAENATLEQASELLDYVLREVKERKAKEQGGH